MNDLILYTKHYLNYDFKIAPIYPYILDGEYGTSLTFKIPDVVVLNDKLTDYNEKELTKRISETLGEGCVGLAAILPLDWIVLDFDKAYNSFFLSDVLLELNLDVNYPWIVETGGNGYHIYLKVDCISFLFEYSKTFPFKKQFRYCGESLDIIVKGHTVLPPSKHKSGGKYRFQDLLPEVEPSEVDFDVLQKFFSKYLDQDVSSRAYHEFAIIDIGDKPKSNIAFITCNSKDETSEDESITINILTPRKNLLCSRKFNFVGDQIESYKEVVHSDLFNHALMDVKHDSRDDMLQLLMYDIDFGGVGIVVAYDFSNVLDHFKSESFRWGDDYKSYLKSKSISLKKELVSKCNLATENGLRWPTLEEIKELVLREYSHRSEMDVVISAYFDLVKYRYN